MASGVAGEALADQRLHQLGLAVAGDAGDADDLAAPDLEADVVEVDAELLVAGQREAADLQPHGADRPGLALGRDEGGADHHLGQAARGLLPGVAAADHLAAAQDGGAVAQRADLLQLVGDVEDRAALRHQPAQGGEQHLDLLRRQHRGRLVHDEQLRLLQQAAHDLHALALADRQVADAAVGIELQAVGGRHRDDALAQAVLGELGGDAERDVLGHRQALEQREVLEHHADALVAGLGGLVRRIDLAAEAHDAFVGAHDAVDHLDQRRLAGAVLAQQRVDLLGADGERHVVVGDHAGKALGDALQLEQRPGHRRPSSDASVIAGRAPRDPRSPAAPAGRRPRWRSCWVPCRRARALRLDRSGARASPGRCRARPAASGSVPAWSPSRSGRDGRNHRAAGRHGRSPGRARASRS